MIKGASEVVRVTNKGDNTSSPLAVASWSLVDEPNLEGFVYE